MSSDAYPPTPQPRIEADSRVAGPRACPTTRAQGCGAGGSSSPILRKAWIPGGPKADRQGPPSLPAEPGRICTLPRVQKPERHTGSSCPGSAMRSSPCLWRASPKRSGWGRKSASCSSSLKPDGTPPTSCASPRAYISSSCLRVRPTTHRIIGGSY